MTDPITKTQRWLDLIALLLGRKVPLTVEEIMERLPAYSRSWTDGDEKARGSVRRMFERDKDELRAMGIPIDSVRYEINYGAEIVEGYRIVRRDFYLPYLRVLASESGPRTATGAPAIPFTDADARTALDALREIEAIPGFPLAAEARSARSKLDFDLDADRFEAAPVVWVEPPGASEVIDRLAVLSDALLAGKRVRFRYHGIARGSATDREVEPYGLFLQRDWYLVGRDLGRDAVRVFRVGRMEEPVANARAPKEREYEVPGDFELGAYLGRPAWRLDEEDPIPVDVHFRFPSSLVVARNDQGALISEGADGSSVRRYEVTDPGPFLRWVLGFAGEATVTGPPPLRDEFRATAAALAARHGPRDA